LLSDNHGPIFEKPVDERMPPAIPRARATHGSHIKSQLDPIATPPARVALRMISISSFPKKILEVQAELKTLPTIPIVVLTIILCYAVPSARAPLKDGQYIQRKILPTTAIISD